MTGATILLDEHVGRVFERTLRERGFSVVQAKDRVGEHKTDAQLLEWCKNHGTVLLSNNAREFESLHSKRYHSGIFLYRDQSLPATDPEGLARTVEVVFDQYGHAAIENQLVDRGEWYDWLHE